jgi:hypothetical protein
MGLSPIHMSQWKAWLHSITPTMNDLSVSNKKNCHWCQEWISLVRRQFALLIIFIRLMQNDDVIKEGQDV